MVLAKERFNLRARDLGETTGAVRSLHRADAHERRGFDEGGSVSRWRKGAAESVRAWVSENGGVYPEAVAQLVESVSNAGGTPLVVAEGQRVLGVVQLKDVVKGGIRERFAQLRKMGIRTVMITGDNPLTAAAIAAEAGVDDFMAQATPEDKLARIREEQAKGHLVAMTGDGTNDAPALAQADVGVAMNTGTQAAREAGNMVDLDSNPTKLIEIVEIGKQLLMTRGALTTFSIANDVAKYFAIIPAMFIALYATAPGQPGPLAALNIMGLHSPQSAILSAVIFNALIIVALIPLALPRCPLPRGRCRGRAPAQRAHLRPRRPARAFPRHQSHRPHPHRAPTRMKTMLQALRLLLALTLLTGFAYPLLVTALGALAVSAHGRRFIAAEWRRCHRLRAARAKDGKPAILLAAPERRGLRDRGQRRQQPRPDQRRAAAGHHRAPREIRRCRSRRSVDRLRQRSRSAPQPRSRFPSGRAGGHDSSNLGGTSDHNHQRKHRTSPARIPRRSARECDETQPEARCREIATSISIIC